MRVTEVVLKDRAFRPSVYWTEVAGVLGWRPSELPAEDARDLERALGDLGYQPDPADPWNWIRVGDPD